jgi:hypothetical protein
MDRETVKGKKIKDIIGEKMMKVKKEMNTYI